MGAEPVAAGDRAAMQGARMASIDSLIFALTDCSRQGASQCHNG
jgi:hypothetical protein